MFLIRTVQTVLDRDIVFMMWCNIHLFYHRCFKVFFVQEKIFKIQSQV